MISIITPSLNQGKYIARTIKSVLSQNVTGLEYIIIDGGSTDRTLDVLEHYSYDLRYVSEKDNGQAQAVNKGLRMCTQDIIGWLNSDDMYYPNVIPIILDFFEKHPDVDVVYGKANHIDQFDQTIEPYPTEKWNLNRLKQTCFISQPAVFFRRRVLERFGLLNENLHYCMDYEYWLRLAFGGAKFAYLPQIFAGSRLYLETKTLRAPLEAHREVISMLHKKLNYIPVNWLITDAILIVKSKTKHKMPELRYILLVFTTFFILVFRSNGFLKSWRSFFEFPKAWIMRYRKKFRIVENK